MVRDGVCSLSSDEFFRDDVLALIFNLSVSWFFFFFYICFIVFVCTSSTIYNNNNTCYSLWKFIAFYVYVHDITNRCFVATTLMTMTTDDGVGEVACAPVYRIVPASRRWGDCRGSRVCCWCWPMMIATYCMSIKKASYRWQPCAKLKQTSRWLNVLWRCIETNRLNCSSVGLGHTHSIDLYSTLRVDDWTSSRLFSQRGEQLRKCPSFYAVSLRFPLEVIPSEFRNGNRFSVNYNDYAIRQ